MRELRGKTAVITGAASGMGRAFSERFAAEGMNLVLADIERPPLDDVCERVRTAGVDVIAVPTDVSDAGAVERLRDAAIERFGRVNLLCNNAGVSGSMMGEDGMHLSEWQWVLGVNLWGVIHGHAAFLPHLMEHGDAHIVNTASMAGHFAGHSPYSASKAAVVGITEGLYLQLKMRRSTVGVSCLCPGWVATSIHKSERNRPEWAAPNPLDPVPSSSEMIKKMLAERIESGQPPEEVANLVHDAVVEGQFWIFPDKDMLAAVEPRFRAILAGQDPPAPTLM